MSRSPKSRLVLSMVGAIALLSFSGATAVAHTFTFTDPDPTNSSGGQITTTAFSTTYDTHGSVLDFHVTTRAKSGGHTANGFWLVLSDGPNPKSHVNEYAILYGDAVNNRLSAYLYNGVNGPNSYQTPGILIDSFTGKIDYQDLGGGSSSFSIRGLDVTSINSFTPSTGDPNDWDGVQFGSKIGVWFHPAFVSSFQYYGDHLAEFWVKTEGWYDFANRKTQPGGQVVEPGTIGLFGLALLGLGLAVRSARVHPTGPRPSLGC